jgi:hypothetical protein
VAWASQGITAIWTPAIPNNLVIALSLRTLHHFYKDPQEKLRGFSTLNDLYFLDIDQVASSKLICSYLAQFRFSFLADGLSYWAAGVETTPSGRIR